MLYVSYSSRTFQGREFDSSKEEKTNIKSEMYK